MSWRTVKLGDVCTIEKGITGIQKAIPGPYPMVVTSEERKSHNEYQFDAEAVIVPLVSSTGHGHASLKRIHYQAGKFALGSILCAIIPNDNNILNAEYLYRFLDLNKENELVRRMKGMANVSLPLKEIAQIEIPLPPTIEEQLEFVESYKQLESQSSELSAELTHQLDLVKQLRQAFLREAMQGKLTPSLSQESGQVETGQQLLAKIKAEKAQLIAAKKLKKEKDLPPIKPEEIPFEIPKHWTWCRLGEIALTISTGPFGTMLHKHDYVPDGIPLINPMNIVNEKIVASEKMMVSENTKDRLKNYAVEIGDVVVGRRGEMGRCAVVSEYENGWLCGTGSFFLRLHQEIYRPFFVKFLSSDFTKKTLLGKSVGSTMDNLNHRILNELTFPLPPLSEQQRIVEKLESLMQTCDALEASIKDGQRQNEQLLQQVLREALRK